MKISCFFPVRQLLSFLLLLTIACLSAVAQSPMSFDSTAGHSSVLTDRIKEVYREAKGDREIGDIFDQEYFRWTDDLLGDEKNVDEGKIQDYKISIKSVLTFYSAIHPSENMQPGLACWLAICTESMFKEKRDPNLANSYAATINAAFEEVCRLADRENYDARMGKEKGYCRKKFMGIREMLKTRILIYCNDPLCPAFKKLPDENRKVSIERTIENYCLRFTWCDDSSERPLSDPQTLSKAMRKETVSSQSALSYFLFMNCLDLSLT
jgi:hypothetical protein